MMILKFVSIVTSRENELRDVIEIVPVVVVAVVSVVVARVRIFVVCLALTRYITMP